MSVRFDHRSESGSPTLPKPKSFPFPIAPKIRLLNSALLNRIFICEALKDENEAKKLKKMAEETGKESAYSAAVAYFMKKSGL